MNLLLFCRRKDLHTPLSVECDSDVQVGVGIDVVFAIWAPAYVNHFDNLAAHIWTQKSSVSSSVVRVETKVWEGGQCEVVGEGNYTFREDEEGMEGQEWGSTPSSSRSPQREFEVNDHDHQLAIALAEDILGVAVEEDLLAKRLSDLNPESFVPRVIADIPSTDAYSAKNRLLDRLKYHGLAERQMAGDGNCQFRALADQLYGSPDNFSSVRADVVEQLSQARDSYTSHVPMEFDDYLKVMASDGAWGDHVTLQAAADKYGVRINLVTSFEDRYFIEIKPAQQRSNRVLYLSFWSEYHYNSIYPLEGIFKPM
nr:uncharacterized protein LOC112275388 isoform X2 [Physcomitrium patens]|eukprot:XP_024361513.1 uncharacterized protein LOC112275388 isoform X2 [Physcomitrella patens]